MAEAAAGPSRIASVADEADEMAAASGMPVKAENGHSSSNGAKAEYGEDGADGAHDDELGEDGLPRSATETLYLQNLNEKVQIPVMKETLLTLFKPYRPIKPVTAHHSVRMRGQAFVSFRDRASADRARRDVNEFPLYGKPIIISFARTRSDAVIEKQDGEEALEQWKKTRMELKKEKRRTNPVRLKERAKHKAGASDEPTAKKARLHLPDEYLPPNNVLFVQNLPEGTTQEDLREVFEAHAGLVEIRTIPSKRDIAFIEFADEGSAAVAKEALHNFKIDGETKMKVTYARK